MSDQTMTTPNPTPDTEASALSGAFSRRSFLAGTGLAGAAVFVAACGKSSKKSDSATPTTGADSSPNNDLATAKFAAGLEVLAVGTYKAALDAALAGKLGPVPPAGAEFVKTAMAQHQAHLDKWNGVLKANGQATVTAPDATLKPVVDGKFGKVTDFGGAAMLALELEQIAAATYLKAIPTLKDKAAIQLASSINIIDMQHAAILYFVLGQYPVPDVFAKTDKAASPA